MSTLPSPSSSIPIPSAADIVHNETAANDDGLSHHPSHDSNKDTSSTSNALQYLHTKLMSFSSLKSRGTTIATTPHVEIEEKIDHTVSPVTSLDIDQKFGVAPGNSNLLSWTVLARDYAYTADELAGGKQLQHALAKTYKIGDIKMMQQRFPPFECLRYFCGCSHDVRRAVLKWQFSMKMFAEYKMCDISRADILECFRALSKSIAFGGLDADGCRIITIKYARFFFSDFRNINVFLLAGFYLFYYLTNDLHAHRQGVCLLCDLNGFKLSNFSFTVEKCGIHFFQKVLPIRIKKMYVMDAPWMAHYALKMVLPLLNEKLRKRVLVITNEQLFGLIAANELPQLVAGSFDAQYLRQHPGSPFLGDILSLFVKQSIDLNHLYDQQ